MAGSGLGAISTSDAAGPTGITHAASEPKRKRQRIGHANCVSIVYSVADPIGIANPIAIANGFAYAIANSDGIAISVPDPIGS